MQWRIEELALQIIVRLMRRVSFRLPRRSRTRVPGVTSVPSGTKTPLVQCTIFGAFGCRCANVAPSLFTNPLASLAPRWFTSTFSGVSLNFSQQSPGECVCASGSKHSSMPSPFGHHTKTLHGNISVPVPSGLMGCVRHFSAHSSAVFAT